MIDSTDKWYDTINDKQLNLTIFLDLKKAFDTVNHVILIGKLRKYGGRDIAGDWIQSFLENRKQYCAANGFNSGTRTVTCGSPQGSCFGTLLFLIYLNGLEKCLIDSKARKQNLFNVCKTSSFYDSYVQNIDNWTPTFLLVEQFITFDRAVMVYKIFSKLCTENLWNKLNLKTHYSRYNTRLCRSIQISKYNLKYAKKRFSYSALKIWNEIPFSIRELPTHYPFKKQLKMYLMS